jgi:hypothetical protein
MRLRAYELRLTSPPVEVAVDRLEEDRRMKVCTFLIALALLAPSPSFADHATLASGVAPEGHDLEIELKIGQDFFRLGGHVPGPGGVASGWLNGRLLPGGFSVDGRLKPETGRPYNFKFDVDGLDRLATMGTGTRTAPPLEDRRMKVSVSDAMAAVSTRGTPSRGGDAP